jgi:hypothetical protein
MEHQDLDTTRDEYTTKPEEMLILLSKLDATRVALDQDLGRIESTLRTAKYHLRITDQAFLGSAFVGEMKRKIKSLEEIVDDKDTEYKNLLHKIQNLRICLDVALQDNDKYKKNYKILSASYESEQKRKKDWKAKAKNLEAKTQQQLDELAKAEKTELIFRKLRVEEDRLKERNKSLLQRIHELELKQEETQTPNECAICMDAPAKMACTPCGHVAMCSNCGKDQTKCPICRAGTQPLMLYYP